MKRTDRDEDDFPDELPLEVEKCFYCDRKGGVPFLAVGDDVYCSRCFEDFTLEEFRAWLEDAGMVRKGVESIYVELKKEVA